MTTLLSDLQSALQTFRRQGMQLSDINPITALADMISEKFYDGEIKQSDIKALLDELSQDIWSSQSQALAHQAGLSPQGAEIFDRLDAHDTQLETVALDKPLYRAVFTAHPVFALQNENSQLLCKAAMSSFVEGDGPNQTIPQPKNAYEPRSSVTLDDEHAEAMHALTNARKSIKRIHTHLLLKKAETGTSS